MMARQLVLMCWSGLSEWVAGSLEPLCAARVRGLCFLWMSPVLLIALHMPLRTFVGREAIARARGPETCVSCANAVPRAVWVIKRGTVRAHFGHMT